MTGPVTFYIAANTFLDPESKVPLLGGTETYTAALADLSARSGGQTLVFQRAGHLAGETPKTGLTVHSWTSVADLRDKLTKLRARDPGLLFLYEPIFAPKRTELPCILIHHGVGSDGTADSEDRPRIEMLLADVRRRYRWLKEAASLARICSSYSRVLCVDTNFINQVRYCHPMYDWSRHLVFVPNFGPISADEIVENKWKKFQPGAAIVLFARRFVIQRGIYLWAQCLPRLATQFPSSEFRIVGHGPGERQIQSLIREYPNIRMYQRTHAHMQHEHEQAHIEVVPSLWSEGTSLSAIEAMGAGCAVVGSDVGGLGNLILPDCNGCLVPPNADALTRTMERLLATPNLAADIGSRAHKTARCAFSVEAWEKRLTGIVEEAVQAPHLGHAPRRLKPVS